MYYRSLSSKCEYNMNVAWMILGYGIGFIKGLLNWKTTIGTIDSLASKNAICSSQRNMSQQKPSCESQLKKFEMFHGFTWDWRSWIDPNFQVFEDMFPTSNFWLSSFWDLFFLWKEPPLWVFLGITSSEFPWFSTNTKTFQRWWWWVSRHRYVVAGKPYEHCLIWISFEHSW